MRGPLIGKHFMSLNLTELLLSESVLCDALSKKGPLILKLLFCTPHDCDIGFNY